MFTCVITHGAQGHVAAKTAKVGSDHLVQQIERLTSLALTRLYCSVWLESLEPTHLAVIVLVGGGNVFDAGVLNNRLKVYRLRRIQKCSRLNGTNLIRNSRLIP